MYGVNTLRGAHLFASGDSHHVVAWWREGRGSDSNMCAPSHLQDMAVGAAWCFFLGRFLAVRGLGLRIRGPSLPSLLLRHDLIGISGQYSVVI
jgi:hypothetical protein